MYEHMLLIVLRELCMLAGISNGARASWMPTVAKLSFGLAGAHIQRTLSGQRSHAGGG